MLQNDDLVMATG